MPWLLLSSRRLQGHSYGIPTIGDPVTSKPLFMGSDIALVKLWTRSHKSHLGLRWFLAHNFTPAHEPPARHPLSKPADRFLHVDTLRENRMFFTRDYHEKKTHALTGVPFGHLRKKHVFMLEESVEASIR